jgi:hypothetical protein
MKIILQTGTGNLVDLQGRGDNYPTQALRLVEWPVVPREGDEVHPYINCDDATEVEGVIHLFELGVIVIYLTEPRTLEAIEDLKKILENEKLHWHIRSQSDLITRPADAARWVMSQ